ncbi:MAG TPA: FAD-dependent oxidoreductase [Nitrobacter sp.]|nr:FAD-dependent oxidoreductase [Nitrobacter sp.]
MSGLVVIGASYAGIQSALSAREEGFTGKITVVCDETWLPYQRPPLSKDFLVGVTSEDHLVLRNETFFEKECIDLALGRRATEIDPAAKRVTLDDGAVLDFDKLVLATGSRARRIAVPGADLDGVCYLRSVTDALDLKARLAQASEVVIAGGGFIGLEVASSAAKLGKKVTVVESVTRLLERAVCPLVSNFLHDTHLAAGVDVRTGESVIAIEGNNGRVAAVTLASGAKLPADLVLVGIGGIANDDLARAAGLACTNGVVVDEHGRTEHPNIYAAGDCANHYNRFAEGWIRLESVQNAQDQAKAAGLAIAGRHEPYDAVPRFWSDQYDAKLQIVGLSARHDRLVVRGSEDDGKFSVFFYRGDDLIAADSINRPGDQMACRRLIAAGVSPRPEEAADPSFDLRPLVKAADKTNVGR